MATFKQQEIRALEEGGNGASCTLFFSLPSC